MLHIVGIKNSARFPTKVRYLLAPICPNISDLELKVPLQRKNL